MRFFLACLVSFLMNAYSYAAQLTIGTLASDAPFETAADNHGHFFGFDIDIMNEICNRLQEKCRYKSYTFENLLSATQSGSIDLAIAGISITLEREQYYLFSLPYLISKAELLTTASSPIKNFNDVNGKRVGIEAGTVFKRLALKSFPGIKITSYSTQNDLFQAVSDGSIDVAILDAASAQNWIINNSSLFKSVGSDITIGSGYGIMTNLNNAALIDRINKALISMENDGSYLAIYKRYFETLIA